MPNGIREIPDTLTFQDGSGRRWLCLLQGDIIGQLGVVYSDAVPCDSPNEPKALRAAIAMHQFFKRLTLILLPLGLLCCFLAVSFYGLDFGVQWDEPRAKIDSIRNTLASGLFLQSSAEIGGWSYNYGGVNYLLTWAGFTPEMLHYFSKSHLTRQALSDLLTPRLDSMPFRLRVRGIFLVLSSLAIPWLFYLAIALGRSLIEAFLAAAILAGSWEFAYHSRYMAPDAVMMQFGVLAFLCLAVAYIKPNLRWFYLGAIAVGLAAGTKYPGILILPLFLIGAANALWKRRKSIVHVATHCSGVAGATMLTFLITTPGVLIDPFNFFSMMREQRGIYKTGWYGYTVRPGFSHLAKIVKYFMLQGFSHYWTLSIIVTLFCVAGLLLIASERKLLGLLILAFVAAYVGYFSRQAAMIVRNLLVVLPFLCLAAARGMTWIATAGGRRVKVVLYACVGILLAMNFGWQVYAADQIKRRADLNYFVNKFENYVRSDSGNMYLITTKLSGALAANSAPVPGNVTVDPRAPHSKAAFFQSEGPDVLWANWPSNSWGLYEKYFGALEVNLEAYTTFAGNERIIVVKAENLKKLPLQLMQAPELDQFQSAAPGALTGH